MNSVLKEKLKSIDYLNSINSLLGWDQSTQMPVKSTMDHANIMAYGSSLYQQLNTDPELKILIEELSQDSDLSAQEKAIIRNMKKNQHFYSIMPPSFYHDLSKSMSEGFYAWEEARKHNDFSIYAPKLERNINLTKQLATALGYEQNPYNGLLNHYENGLSTETIDPIFENLKTTCMGILQSQKTTTLSQLPKTTYPIEKQKIMAHELLKLINFDIEAGYLGESTHPFTCSISPTDVRLTVRYNEHDFTEAFYATLHEGGHGLYEQNINQELFGTTLCSGTSMSIHESCSRIIENQVGRNKKFIQFYLPKLQEYFPELKSLSVDELYQIVNKCEASLIRIHADEVSYNIHIIIRYEMEKTILNEDISVYELPNLWNQKYTEYLGITPKNDLEGILQDVHWSSLLMGYFPSYALGSIYAAQLFDIFEKENPFSLENGSISPLTSWLKEKIYKHGSIYTPSELIYQIANRDIDVDPYIKYLRSKSNI